MSTCYVDTAGWFTCWMDLGPENPKSFFLCLYSKCVMHWAISWAPNYLIFNILLGEREKEKERILCPTLKYFNMLPTESFSKKFFAKAVTLQPKLNVKYKMDEIQRSYMNFNNGYFLWTVMESWRKTGQANDATIEWGLLPKNLLELERHKSGCAGKISGQRREE